MRGRARFSVHGKVSMFLLRAAATAGTCVMSFLDALAA
jgi:hypothetical protein